MSSFYGNVKSSPRSPFIFDKIYSSRTEMDTALTVQTDSNNAVQGDGVFINRYVLINYGYTINGGYIKVNNNLITSAESYANLYINIDNEYILGSTLSGTFNDYKNSNWYKKDHYITRYNKDGEENTYFKNNRQKDQQKYNADYHLTVWMKIYMDNEEKYIMVAKLNPEAPAIELRETSPAEGKSEGQLGPHWDLIQSSDINWVYDVPKHWDISLNTQDINSQNDEDDVDSITQITGDELPYFNSAGFDDKISNNTNLLEDNDPRKINRIWFAPFKSGTEYPIFEFKEIELTPDTYIKNKYYISNFSISDDDYDPDQIYYTYDEDTNKYILATGINSDNYSENICYIATFSLCQEEWTSGTSYYIKTQKIEENQLKTDKQYDQKRLSISLPSIGNAVSDLYDSIYGKPNFPNLLGYTDETTANNYESNESEEHFISVRINNSETGEKKYLNQTDIDDLYHDNASPHSIPVYDTTCKRRPYTSKQLYDAIGIEPYNNITQNDPISMAWGIEEIKKYISELRFLSHGGPGFRIIGYTNNDKINDEEKGYLTTKQDNTTHCLIVDTVDTEYWLTNTNIEELQPYSQDYPLPVYEYIEDIGLQSDWTLDDTNAFGYIYHKPRILWSNSNYISQDNESEVNKGTENGIEDTNSYALHSIEYIFDHCMDEGITTQELFGNSRNPLNRF